MHVQVFALGYVGFIAHISNEEVLFRKVLDSPDAIIRFHDILASGAATAEAKIYALCALRALSPQDFQRALDKLPTALPEITVLRVDILSKEKASHLLQQIALHGCPLAAGFP